MLPSRDLCKKYDTNLTHPPEKGPKLLKQFKEVDNPLVHPWLSFKVDECILHKREELCLKLTWHRDSSPWNMVGLTNIEACKGNNGLPIE